jgi:surface protein
MKIKKVLAVVMSLCMVAGAVSYGAPVISQVITAQASPVNGSCYSLDESTGVLTLKGNVEGDVLRNFDFGFKSSVKSIVAEKGTVFPQDSRELFDYYRNCTSIDLSNADTSKVTNMSGMFCNSDDIKTLDVSGFDTKNVEDMSCIFWGCESLNSLDISNFDTSNVTDMHGMFLGCESLTSLDVSNIDTSKVANMRYMFCECTNLTELDLSSFDTSNVTNMSEMFRGCNKLSEVNVSGFDTSKVTDMSKMFTDCSGLSDLDVSSFDTGNVSLITDMFSGCSSLTSLDLRNFNTSNVSYFLRRGLNGMFSGCSSLTSLDISSFDTTTISDMTDMFSDCKKLNTLTLGENFKSIEEEAALTNGAGWVNANSPAIVISGNGEFAEIENNGKNTYKRIFLTYPDNIKIEYSKKYHQIRFTWDEVEDADRYGIAVYLAGKWRVQTQNITGTVYTSPKNLTPGKTYKVAIAARVNGKWDTANAIKNAVTVTIK